VFIIDRGRIVADGTPESLRSAVLGRPALAVELKGADGDGATTLAALPGVAAVTPLGGGRFRLEHETAADPREAVFRLAVERGWVLLQMTPEATSLEQVFVRLTTHEGEPAPSADVEA
jgi:ABC-2 type transport system ATP-binding protein